MDNDVFFIPNKFADPPIPIDPIPVLDPLPPIWNPNPTPPWLPPNPGDGPQNGGGPTLRAYIYSGVVRDAYTELPLAGATVTLYAGSTVLARQAANGLGQFQINTGENPAQTISISVAGFHTFTWPASEVQHVFDLEPNIREGDPVIIPVPPAHNKTNPWVWIIGGIVVAKWQKWI